MTRLRYETVCLITLVVSAGMLSAESDLETLRVKYETSLDGIVKQHDSKTADLNDRYLKALTKLLQTVKQEGDQDKVNAVSKELNYFEFGFLDKQDISSKEAQQFSALYSLQSAYRKQVSQLDAEKENKVLSLVQQYDRALEQQESTLTGQGLIAEAHEVLRERDSFRASPEFKSVQSAIAESQKSQALTVKQTEAPKVPETASPEQAGPAQSSSEQARIDITVRKGKKSDDIDGNDDNEQLNLSVSIKNREPAKDFMQLKGSVFLFSKDMSGGSGCRLMIKETFDFNLPRQGTYIHNCRPVSQVYDNKGSVKDGLKYAGHVVVIRDEKGEILRSHATKSTWLNRLEELERVNPGQYMDFQAG